jgi:hypothetical protein
MKSLYFIGNGFDIAHDIESQYDDLVTMLEELYSCTVKDLWREFEKALNSFTSSVFIFVK